MLDRKEMIMAEQTIMSGKDWMQKAEANVLHTYNRFPVVFEKGNGVTLTDIDGKEYLDFAAGIAV